MIAVVPLKLARCSTCAFLRQRGKCDMLGTIFKFYDCKFLKVYLTLDGDRFTWENVDIASNSGGGITCFYT
jgi:TRAP-type mannitol/chloroaromatic compound transport system permease small subunit